MKKASLCALSLVVTCVNFSNAFQDPVPESGSPRCESARFQYENTLAHRVGERRGIAGVVSGFSAGFALFGGAVFLVGIPISYVAVLIMDKRQVTAMDKEWREENCVDVDSFGPVGL